MKSEEVKSMTSEIDAMKDLLRTGNMCVLATCADGKPHCSLMAYITDDEVTTVFMVTLKETQKYRNFLKNPQASLLVDTRNEQRSAGRERIQALTVSGTFQTIEEENERQQVLGKMADKHPHLRELLERAGAEPFAIKIKSLLLLEGALEAQYAEL
jgi:nitroimidazol reductase NimA-like FMN-containing flavoprotein (pyridoxamine 5'-phosphate oxidase superfamily)